jgi:stage II sporulation protein D
VDSPGEQDKSYQNSKVTFTAKEFQEKLGITLAGTPKNWFGKVTYSDGGGVDKAVIGGKTYTGVKLRSLLGLRSTKFTVEATQSSVIIKTNGYGHRVGMSQYGADAMAVSGSNYKEILKHYYKGIEIVRYPITAD